MIKARAISTDRNDWRVATHYRLSAPVMAPTWIAGGAEIVDVPTVDVVVSAVRHEFAHETLVFRAYPDGTIADYAEISGLRKTMDHGEVLALMGCVIV